MLGEDIAVGVELAVLLSVCLGSVSKVQMQQSIGVDHFGLFGLFGSNFDQLEVVNVHAGAGAAQDDSIVKSGQRSIGGQGRGIVTAVEHNSAVFQSEGEFQGNLRLCAINDGGRSHHIGSSGPVTVQRAGDLDQMLNGQSGGRISLFNHELDTVGLAGFKTMVEADDRAGPAGLVGDDQLAVLHGHIHGGIAAVAVLGEDIAVGVERAIGICVDLRCIRKIQMQQQFFRAVGKNGNASQQGSQHTDYQCDCQKSFAHNLHVTSSCKLLCGFPLV